MSASSIRTTLYAASVAPLADSALYAAAYSAVSPQRRSKTDRYRFASDRYLSLGAELLLLHGLRAAGLSAIRPDFDYGPHGKPYLKHAGVHFNISHSGEYALCAIAEDEVGCDVEKLSAMDLKIAARFFAHEEYADIAAQPTPDAQIELCLRYWTLKESFIKATGLGMTLPLNAFRIVRGNVPGVIQSVNGRDYRFAEYQDLPGYGCALCTAGKCQDAPLRVVSIEEIIEATRCR